MGFLNDAGEFMGKGVNKVDNKRKKIALKAQIADINRDRAKLLTELGERIYLDDPRSEALAAKYPDLVRQIQELDAKIFNCNQEIESITASEIEAKEAAKRAAAEKAEAQRAAQSAAAAAMASAPVSAGSDSGIVCSQCGAPMKPEHRFCAQCGGTPVSAQPAPAAVPEPASAPEEAPVAYTTDGQPIMRGPGKACMASSAPAFDSIEPFPKGSDDCTAAESPVYDSIPSEPNE
ncbi:MAG: zinc ribbon domain-containing protein [bacterium]|nr:zinc ribbon domain-containing protein [bacterium]